MRSWIYPLIACLVCGCGYRPLGIPPELEGEIEIRMMQNQSNVPGVEKMMSDAIAEEFLRRGQLEPTFGGSPGDPNLVFRGVVREVTIRHTAFSSVALALEDQVELVVDVSVARRATGEVLWKREQWSELERFTTSADAQVYDSNRRQALRRLASLFAGRIYDEFLQSF